MANAPQLGAALPQLAGYFAGSLHALPCNNKGAEWGGLAGYEPEAPAGFLGLEEIFLKVTDMDAALEFYVGALGIPIERRTETHAFLQCALKPCLDLKYP